MRPVSTRSHNRTITHRHKQTERRTDTYANTHARPRTQTQTDTHTNTHARTQARTHTCTQAHTHTHTHIDSRYIVFLKYPRTLTCSLNGLDDDAPFTTQGTSSLRNQKHLGASHLSKSGKMQQHNGTTAHSRITRQWRDH